MASIFVDPNGDPLTFYTTPTKEVAEPAKYSKGELRKKIEAHGGQMLGKPEAGCIRLVRKDSVVCGTSFDYIYACINVSKLLDAGLFKIDPAAAKKKKPKRGVRTEWTHAEEQAIIEYTRMYGSEQEISGATIPSRAWMTTMVESLPGVVVHHTESVRSRWRTVLQSVLAKNRFTKVQSKPKPRTKHAQPKPANIDDDEDPIESAGSNDDSDFQQHKLPPRTARTATTSTSAAKKAAASPTKKLPRQRGPAAQAAATLALAKANGGSDGSESDDDDELDDCDTELMGLLKQQQQKQQKQPEEAPEKAMEKATKSAVKRVSRRLEDGSNKNANKTAAKKTAETAAESETVTAAAGGSPQKLRRERSGDGGSTVGVPSMHEYQACTAPQPASVGSPKSKAKAQGGAKKRKTPEPEPEPEPEPATVIREYPLRCYPLNENFCRTKKQKLQPESEPSETDTEMDDDEFSDDMALLKKVMGHLAAKTNRTPLDVLQTMYNCSGNAAHALKAMTKPGSMKLWAPDHDKWLASDDAATVENANKIYGVSTTDRRVRWNES